MPRHLTTSREATSAVSEAKTQLKSQVCDVNLNALRYQSNLEVINNDWFCEISDTPPVSLIVCARFLESKTTGNERRHSRSWAKANKQCEKVWVRLFRTGTRSPARPSIRLRSARGREQEQEWDAVIGSRAVRERTEFLKSRSVYWSICLSHSAEP